jgi:hypothetical protein
LLKLDKKLNMTASKAIECGFVEGTRRKKVVTVILFKTPTVFRML